VGHGGPQDTEDRRGGPCAAVEVGCQCTHQVRIPRARCEWGEVWSVVLEKARFREGAKRSGSIGVVAVQSCLFVKCLSKATRLRVEREYKTVTDLSEESHTAPQVNLSAEDLPFMSKKWHKSTGHVSFWREFR
jgi:hypothetical protein